MIILPQQIKKLLVLGPQIHGGYAHQAVGPQAATADIPSWANTVCAKRRFNFQDNPGAHAETHDHSSPLAFLKTFITNIHI